jgi:hypothetical protein
MNPSKPANRRSKRYTEYGIEAFEAAAISILIPQIFEIKGTRVQKV